MKLRPMLAAPVGDINTLRYPLLASAKLDGVRALVFEGVVLSRTLKPIPSQAVQQAFGHLEGYDGELIVGSLTAWNCYRRTVSAVMTELWSNVEELTFRVFDNILQPQAPYVNRLESVDLAYRHLHKGIMGPRDLIELEEQALAAGYEGLILRDPAAEYKMGRSTQKQGWMLKLKRFTDAEATVVGFEELYSNRNPAQLDERGYTKHSHHQANLVPMGTLGALLVEYNEMSFAIGTGFTHVERIELWQRRELLVGKLVKFKYFEVGMKDAPRHPVFLGFRDKEDV